MLIHYGLYSQLGIVESWSICGEEEDWIPRDSTITYDAYKRNYWNTINSFKPEKLDPASWAKYGKKAGMNYVVFTTKHHDGFNLFDTKQSDFSVTKGAFKNDPRSNIAKEVFNAFRSEGYMIGAYYSKPDWHSQYYWWDRYPTPNRNNNYNIEENKWRWNKFKEFTYNQIEEMCIRDSYNIRSNTSTVSYLTSCLSIKYSGEAIRYTSHASISISVRIIYCLHTSATGDVVLRRGYFYSTSIRHFTCYLYQSFSESAFAKKYSPIHIL